MKIFLCRHGQTTGDVEDRYGGVYDDDLTAEGKQQAVVLAQQLSGKGIQKVVTSSLIRAKDTGETLSKALNVTTEVHAGLNERNIYGILSGKVKSEAKAEFPELAENLKDYRNTIQGAEPYVDARDRMVAAIHDITSKDNGPVAIVTHGGTIKSIFRELLGTEVANVEDCGYAELEWVENKLAVLSLHGIEIAA